MFGKSKGDNDTTGTSRRVRNLAAQLGEAHEVHRLAADPLLGAVNAVRLRSSVTRTMWFFLAVGLGFTTTGVHDFLAGHLNPADPMWWGAWLAEPALAGILITLLRWEAAMLSHGVSAAHTAVSRLKRVLLSATLIANVWAALAPSHGAVSKGMVFFHLVIPTVVFLLAEVMPVIQQRCTEVRDQALTASPPMPAESQPAPAPAAPTMPAEIPDPAPPATSAPAPVMPAEIPPAPALAPVTSPRLKLPPEMTGRINAVVADVRREGREATTEDIRRAVRVPEEMAVRILADLTTRNGHHITA